MKQITLRRLLAAATLFLAPACIKAQAATYTLKRIEIPGAAKIAATGMNDAGAIVGTYIGDHGNAKSFLMRNGSVQLMYASFGIGFRTAAYPISIDNRGEILGASCFVICLGATYSGTLETSSFGLGAAQSTTQVDRLVAQNATGTIIYLVEGLSDSFSVGTQIGNAQGFTPIIAPAGTNIYANSINSAGTVAGTLMPATGTVGTPVAFTYNNGIFTTIAIPEATAISDVLINSRNDIAGVYSDASNHSHLWFYRAGRLHILPTHTAHAYFALSAINASGAVAGVTDVPGTTRIRAFVYNGGPDLDKVGEWNNVPIAIGALTSEGRVLLSVNGTKSYIASCTDC